MTTKHHGTIDLSTILPSSTLEDHTLAGYAWVITEDRINDTDSSRVGTLGPRSAPTGSASSSRRPDLTGSGSACTTTTATTTTAASSATTLTAPTTSSPPGPRLKTSGCRDAGAVRISYPDAPHLDCA